MVENVYDFETIVTDSEFEALVLECSLIKQYTPKYNILLKDDKGYSCLLYTSTAATFHSACVRILRREIERLGYSRNFTIYDTDDSLKVIKEAMKALHMEEKLLDVYKRQG